MLLLVKFGREYMSVDPSSIIRVTKREGQKKVQKERERERINGLFAAIATGAKNMTERLL
jgi:hypothetical protein